MEELKVQIDLVVKIGREIMARGRHCGALGQYCGAHFGGKLIDVFRVPEVARNYPARPLSIRLVEQSFCFLDIRNIEALSEPGTNGCKQILGLTTTSLSLQDSAEAHRRPQFKEPSTLLPCRFKGLVQTRFHLIATARFEKQFTLDSM
jgi:hypothetical protein